MGTASGRRALAVQAQVFTVLWAIAHLGHLLRKGDPTDPLVWGVFLAALVVLARPRSWWAIGLLAAVQVAYLYRLLPATDNHLLILGAGNLGVLVAALSWRWRRVREDERDDRQADGLTPADRVGHPVVGALPYLRLAILIAYGAAAIAKLNAGFFDIAESCAVTMTDDALAILGDRAPALPLGVQHALPFVIAGVELAIPLLLLVRRTRLIGVATVVVFHLAMSLSPTATAGDFTLVLFAFAFLFLPPQAGIWFTEWWSTATAPLRQLTSAGAGGVVVRAVGFAGLGVALGALIWHRGSRYTTVAGNRNWVLIAAAGLVLGGALLAAAWRARTEATSQDDPAGPGAGRTLVPAGAIYVLLLSLPVANAAAPYLGSRSIATFTMYSNLQTEARSSNHLLLPRWPRDGSQDDLVSIDASSNRRLQRLANREVQLTYHELRRRLAADPEASIRFERAGEVVEVDRAAAVPELVTLHPVSHRFIGHRAYDPARASCRW